MDAEEGRARLRALGFGDSAVEELWAHFDGAEQRGQTGHGHARIPWLEQLEGFDAHAEPRLVEEREGFQRWHGNGAVGYLTLGRAVARQLAEPPERARLVVCDRTFPTGMLGHYVRRLAEGGLVAVLTTTSPRRLGHPAGGPKLASTSPLAIGIPSSGGDPVVTDVSMGAVTWGDVIAGNATEEQLVPFGGELAHKAFAIAVGLELLVDSLVSEPGHGAVLLVAQPAADPVPELRRLAGEVRLPGDPK
ncbi:MAG TPA: Ldh family oxidoreductase [Gaiellaceae bacterium]|nr:Ldh family oxidoreductase [Gaiellaceae bacterium]